MLLALPCDCQIRRHLRIKIKYEIRKVVEEPANFTIFRFKYDDQLASGERAHVMEERGGTGFRNEARRKRVVDEHHVGVILVAAICQAIRLFSVSGK